MCTSVASEDYQGEHAQKGLATNHAYTLIGAFETGGVRLVKIRNPWGQYEWNGAWNDNDPNWTDEMKGATNFSAGNDGEFFLSIEDFKEEFGDTTICDCYDDYHFESAEHRESSDGNLTQFTLEEDGMVYLTVAQMAPRMVSKRHGYQAFPSKLLLARHEDDGSFTYVGHKSGHWDAQTTYQAELEAGSYMVWSNIGWDSSKPIRKYNLAVYAPSATNPTSQDGSGSARDAILESAGGNAYQVRSELGL